MNDETGDTSCATNTDPPSVRCWCGRRLRRERGGYWWSCPEFGHPSSHDHRRSGLAWWLRCLLAKATP